MKQSESDSSPLPMPMAPFEEYMLGDDHRAYPMTFSVRLRFTGRIERESFQRALQIAVDRHCLLGAKLHADTAKKFSWCGVEDSGVAIHWLEKADDDSYPPHIHFNLWESAGLGVSVQRSDDSSDIVLQFHHSCCDGQGAFGFIHDLFIAYAIEQGDTRERVVLKPLDPHRYAFRDRMELSLGRIIKMIPKQAVGLLGVRQFVMRRPVSLSGNDPVDLDCSPPNGYPRVKVLRLGPEEGRRLRDTARRHNVTANQLMTSDLFLAIDDWRCKFVSASEDWIRFSIPISVRNDKDRSLPAANKVSMIFLDRRHQDCANPVQLLNSIREESQLIARNQLQWMLLFSLWLTRRTDGNAAGAAKADRCYATTLLSNVGEPFARSPLLDDSGKLVAGRLELKSLDVVAPIRPFTDVAFSICQYAGSYYITMHWDERAITTEQADSLLAGYQERLCHPSY